MKKTGQTWMIDILFFIVILVPLAYMNYFLFYRQSVRLDNLYHSDMYAYILYIEGVDLGLRFPYPIFFLTGKVIYKIFFRHHFLGAELGIAISTFLYEMLALVVTKLVLNFLLKKELSRRLEKMRFGKAWMAGIFLTVAAVALNYTSMLYDISGKGNFWHYRFTGVYSPNPWHNSTYIAVKPFAVLVFFVFSQLFDRITQHAALWKDYLLFSGCLVLATMTKPSYTLVFGAAAAIQTAILLLPKFREYFKELIGLVCAVCPTLVVMVWQYADVFMHSTEGDGGMGFAPGLVWLGKCSNIPVAIVLAAFFPLVVLIFQRKEILRDRGYLLAWLQYLCGMAMFYFLYEKGVRQQDANFSWGYEHGLYFLYFTSFLLLVNRMLHLQKVKKRDIIMLALQWLAFGLHLLCGIGYYTSLMQGTVYT